MGQITGDIFLIAFSFIATFILQKIIPKIFNYIPFAIMAGFLGLTLKLVGLEFSQYNLIYTDVFLAFIFGSFPLTIGKFDRKFFKKVLPLWRYSIFQYMIQWGGSLLIVTLILKKLYGLSDCNDNHTKTSMRLGWRWLNDSLEIHWFKHTNENFSFAKISTINLNTIVNFSITFDENYYHVSVDIDTVTIDRPCNSQSIRKYYLWPYFGGNETAPHDIKIKIKSI